MLISGVCIDATNASLREDGFNIAKTETGYEFSYAVVNVGGRLKTYDGFLTGHYRSYLFPNNNIRKADISFGDAPKDAFIFVIKINFDGIVERFKPLKGQFIAEECVSFDDTPSSQRIAHAVECMDLLARAGNHPFISRSATLNQLMQNINLFASLQLFDYMVNQLGISMLYTGVTAGHVIGNSKEEYRSDVGRLCVLPPKHGIKIINGEGFLVRTQTRRDWVYSMTDVNTGSYTVSISSPFRDDDAILNQIILSEYLEGAQEIHETSCSMRIFGPSIACRDHYLQMTNRKSEFSRELKEDSSKSLSGRLLKDFVTMLVDYRLDSQQMDLLSDKAQSSLNDQIVITSYYLAMNKPLPPKIDSWMKTLCVEGSTTPGTFLHVLSGMPFVKTIKAGGVVSVDINDRLFEVDDCSGYKMRLVKKIHEGTSRNFFELPSSLTVKIQLFEQLLEDHQIQHYMKRRQMHL